MVGAQDLSLFEALSYLPTSTTNQQFSNNLVQLAPGQYFSNVYLLSPAELSGNFSDILPLQLIDPTTNLPFPNNIVPASRLGSFFAFLVGPLAQASVPLNFVPAPPCRAVDTRTPDYVFGGPYIAGNTSRTFALPYSGCAIPDTASAYSLNITVVPHVPLGYLTVWPSDETQPLVSILNSDGRVKADGAIVSAGVNAAISLYATNDTDVVIDTNGYFVPSSTGTGLFFYPLVPCRISDTRYVNGPLGGPSLAASRERDLPVLASSCGVPSSAQAYSLNITAVPQQELGYLTVWPTGLDQPYVSTLNAPTRAVTANGAIVPAGSSGDIAVYPSNNTDVIVDVNGYFADPASGGFHFYTVRPCRVLDSRVTVPGQPFTPGAGEPFSGVPSIPIQGFCGVPSNASVVVVNATVVPNSELGYLTLWPLGAAQPLVSTLNASDGAVTSNMAIVPMGNGTIQAFASNLTHLILDVTGYFAP